MNVFSDWISRHGGYVLTGAFVLAAGLLSHYPHWNLSVTALLLMVLSVVYATLMDHAFSIPYTEHEQDKPNQETDPLAYREWYKDWYAIDARSAAQLNVRLTVIIACWTFFGVFVSTIK